VGGRACGGRDGFRWRDGVLSSSNKKVFTELCCAFRYHFLAQSMSHNITSRGIPTLAITNPIPSTP